MELSTEWDSKEFVTYLTDTGLHKDVIANALTNRVTSTWFLDLTESDLKELALGDRLALRRILEGV